MVRARKHSGRWYRLSAVWGSKEPRWFDWGWRKMDGDVPDGWQAWIVARRSITDPTEIVYHRVCTLKKTTLQQIVEVAGQRWKVEEAIERAKGECGLDQYEIRSWTGWHRHITLSLVAQLCATLMMDQANAESEKNLGTQAKSEHFAALQFPERIGRFLIPYTLSEILHVIRQLFWQQVLTPPHTLA
jgi:hypothetical protein